ncbi:MAG: cytochrome c-type biogenesis protein CcmH [Candidatus Marinimicrobia bacterium]|nr:cytochrome c-type biogenesis protein CcmH [Candidatus Neomarinimicrobiota bacterium]
MNPITVALMLALAAGGLLGQEAKDPLQKELEYMIMAPCCYGAPVGDHDSDAAKQVKAQIAQLLSEGKTSDEVLDMYVAIYGERILAQPRAQGFNVLAYVMPILILVIGGLLVIYAINQMTAPRPQAAQPSRQSYSDEFFQKIEREMEELNV